MKSSLGLVTFAGSLWGFCFLGSSAETSSETVQAAGGQANSAIPAPAQQPILNDEYGDPLPPMAFARLGALRFRVGGPAKSIRFLDSGKKLLVGLNDESTYPSAGIKFQVFDASSGKELNRFDANSVFQNDKAGSSDADHSKFLDTSSILGPKPTAQWSLSASGDLLATVPASTSTGLTKLRLQESATGKVVFEVEENKCHYLYPLLSPDGKKVGVILGRQPYYGIPGGGSNGGGFGAGGFGGGGKGGGFGGGGGGGGGGKGGGLEVDGRNRRNGRENITDTGPNIGSEVIRLWDVGSHQEIRTFVLPAQSGESFQAHWFAFSPDGAFLAASGIENGKTGVVWVWEVAEKKPAWRLGGQTGAGGVPVPFSFSPDSKSLAAMLGTKIGLWDLATAKLVKEVANSRHSVPLLDFSPDGKRLVAWTPQDDSANGPKRLQMWVLDTGKEIALPVEDPLGYLFSKDSKTLVLQDQAQCILVICDAGTGTVQHTIAVDKKRWSSGISKGFHQVLQGMGWPFALAPDGKMLIFADKPGQVRRFDVATGKEIPPPGFDSLVTYALVFSEDGNKLLAADGTRVLLHDVGGKFPPAVLLPAAFPDMELHEPHIQRFLDVHPPALAFSRSGKRVAAGWNNGAVTVWDTTTATVIWQGYSHKWPILSLCFAPDDQTLVSTDQEELLWWNSTTGQIRRRFEKTWKTQKQPERDYRYLAILATRPPTGVGSLTVFSRTTFGESLSEWEVTSGKLRRIFNFQHDPIDISADGRSLLVIGENAYHSVDLSTGEIRRSFSLPNNAPLDSKAFIWGRFSPDGDIVAGIVLPRLIHIWDQKTGTLVAALNDNSGGFRALAFSPLDQTLATAGGDGTILLWRTPSRLAAPGIPLQVEQRESNALVAILTSGDAVAASRALHRLAGVNNAPSLLNDLSAGYAAESEVSRLRILELLDRIGTKEAKSILKTFAAGKPDAWTTRSAAAALYESPEKLNTASSTSGGTKDGEGLGLPFGAETRLGLQRFQNGGYVTALRYGVDGASILSTSTDNPELEFTVNLSAWNATSGKLQSQMEVMQWGILLQALISGSVRPLAISQCGIISPDGKLLATSNSWPWKNGKIDLSLCVREVATDKILLKVEDQTSNIYGLQFQPNGSHLVAVDKSWQIRSFDLASGKENPPLPIPERFQPLKVRFSLDGKILVAVGYDRDRQLEIRLFHFGRSLLTNRIQFVPWGVDEVVLAPDSKHVAIVSAYGDYEKPHLVLLAIESGKIIWDFGEQPKSPGNILFSPDGKQIVIFAMNEMRRWDTASGKELPSINFSDCWFAQFAPDGKTLGVVDSNAVRLHDARSGRELHTFPLDINNITKGALRLGYHRDVGGVFAFSPDSKSVATAFRRTIRQWEVATGNEIGPRPYHETIHAVAVANTARLVASCSPSDVQVWDPAAGKTILRLSSWEAADKKDVALTALALSSDSRRLAVGGEDGKIGLFDVQQGNCLAQLQFHNAGVASLVFFADGKTLVSSDKEAGVALWDASSGELLRKIALPQPAAEKMPKEKQANGSQAIDESLYFLQRSLGTALSPDGRLLLVPSKNSLSVVELASFKPRGTSYPRPHEGKFAISQDGRLLVVGPNWETSYDRSHDSPLHLIDVATGAELRVVADFPRIRDFAISPDSKLLAACGPLGLRIWDTATGTLQASFNGHRGEVTTVAFSPDGGSLVSAAFDGTMLVWDVAALIAKSRKKEFAAGELRALWDQLASLDAMAAGTAMRRLVDHPKESAALLGDLLKPASASKEQIAKLVADLDDNRPKVRVIATKELEQLAEIAEPALRACVTGRPTLEQRQRAEKLLARLSEPTADTEKLRALRAVEVLELLATAEAADVLRRLAGGSEDAFVTREAKAALRRISRR